MRCHQLKIDVIASGSKGNAYAINDGKTTLLLEAGIDSKRMGKVLLKYEGIAGAFITHEHKDHARSTEFLMRRGIPIYASNGTLDAVGCKFCKCGYESIVSGAGVNVGTFRMIPFEVEHDAADPLGFYIYSHESNESIVFATDMSAVYAKFRSFNYLMIECNYNSEILDWSEANGLISRVLAERVQNTHFSLDDVIEFLSANSFALDFCREIYLLHGSAKNCRKDMCRDEIQRLTGIPTYAFGN